MVVHLQLPPLRMHGAPTLRNALLAVAPRDRDEARCDEKSAAVTIQASAANKRRTSGFESTTTDEHTAATIRCCTCLHERARNLDDSSRQNCNCPALLSCAVDDDRIC